MPLLQLLLQGTAACFHLQTRNWSVGGPGNGPTRAKQSTGVICTPVALMSCHDDISMSNALPGPSKQEGVASHALRSWCMPPMMTQAPAHCHAGPCGRTSS